MDINKSKFIVLPLFCYHFIKNTNVVKNNIFLSIISLSYICMDLAENTVQFINHRKLRYIVKEKLRMICK